MELPLARLVGLLPLALAASCTSGTPSAGKVTVVAPPNAPSHAQERALPDLTPREAALLRELKRHVERLAGEIGERNLEKAWNMASATDALATELESYGFAVNRLGFSVGEDVAQNLEVEVRGGKAGGEIVVVGAHYDTHPGSPGADDNASGVAAVLALAKDFRDKSPDKTLRFVLFANEEQPHFQTSAMGSLVYAKALSARGERVVAMLSLESIGYYSDAKGSQKYPEGVSGSYPTVGNFIAVVGNPDSASLVQRVGQALKRHATLPVIAEALPEEVPGVNQSDHWAFWQMGFEAVMITGTAPFRNPHYHAPSDLPGTLDYERMARVVAGLERVVELLATMTAAPTGTTDPTG